MYASFEPNLFFSSSSLRSSCEVQARRFLFSSGCVCVCVCVCVISIKYLFCVCVDFSYLIKVVVHLLVAMIIIFSRSCVYVERKKNLYIYNIRNLVSGIEKQIKSVCVRVVSFFVLFFYFFSLSHSGVWVGLE